MRERHALLQDIPEVITYKREVYSKWIILLIEVGYIPLAGFLSYVEWRLMRVYQTKFHPWINILVGKFNYLLDEPGHICRAPMR